MFVTPPRLSSRPLSFDEQISLLDSVLDDFVRIREPIIGNPKGSPGTAAVVVWDSNTNQHALLTAGHVFPDGPLSNVDILRTNFLSQSREPIGRVSHRAVPSRTNSPGWDAADHPAIFDGISAERRSGQKCSEELSRAGARLCSRRYHRLRIGCNRARRTEFGLVWRSRSVMEELLDDGTIRRAWKRQLRLCRFFKK